MIPRLFYENAGAILGLFIILLTGCGAVAQKPPNILWIVADDLGTELGCYGNPDVSTPALDALALQGIKFTKAYANAPVCSSSRSSLITGMYPTSINCQDHRTINMTELPTGVLPITEYFKKAGYFCTNGSVKDMTQPGKEDYNFISQGLYDGTDWRQRTTGQPFFAQVQIQKPHRPFARDQKHPIDPEKIHLPGCYPDHPLLRADWAWYLENIQHLDHLVNKILQRLEDDGLAQNTIVFFFGDHGRPHLRDKQFLYEGGMKIPLIIRWPQHFESNLSDDQLVSLVDVAATSLKLAGIEIPTDMQGNVFLGEDASERDYVYGFRQRAGDAPDAIRSISDGRYKLIWNQNPQTPWMQLSSYKKAQYPAYVLYCILHDQGNLEAPFNQFMAPTKPEFELYDLQKDPMELVNLIGHKDYQERGSKLRSKLERDLLDFDKNMVVETGEAIQKAKTSAINYYGKQMRFIGLKESATQEDILNFWESQLLDRNTTD